MFLLCFLHRRFELTACGRESKTLKCIAFKTAKATVANSDIRLHANETARKPTTLSGFFIVD
jgi:hypothetical protein